MKPIEIIDVHVPTLTYANGSTTIRYGWAKDQHHYYFKLHKINADHKSLKFINKNFFYDKDSLYTDLQGWKIKTIGSIKEAPKKVTDKYICSDDKIYFIGVDSNRKKALKTIVATCKKKEIEMLNNSVIKTDDQIIYYGEAFHPFDLETFQLINDSEGGYLLKYYKDKKNIYLDKEIIPKADPKTFEVIKFGFSKDKNNVYYEHQLLKGVDSESFKEKKFGLWGDKDGNDYDSKGNKK